METVSKWYSVFFMAGLCIVASSQSSATYVNLPYGYTESIQCEMKEQKIRVKNIITMAYGIPCTESDCTDAELQIINKCTGHHSCNIDFSVQCEWSFNPKASLFYICNDKQNLHCNFEYDFCNWKYTGFERRAPSSTRSTKTFSGKYVAASMKEHSGILESPNVYIKQPVCLTFLYRSPFKLLLRILMVYESQYQESDKQGELVVEFGPSESWIEGKHTLPLHVEPYTCSFRFETSKTEALIDNIRLLNTDCEDTILFIDFEAGFSQYVNIVYNGSPNWIIYPANNYENAIRPRKDHTLLRENGHYITLENMLVEISRHISRFQILFESGMDDKLCLSFWYNMNGANVESLEILVQTDNYDTPNFTEKITPQNGRDNIWIKHFVTLFLAQRQKFKVLFDGILTGTHSSITVDDILVNKGSCIVNEIFYQHDNECTDATDQQENRLLCNTIDIVDRAINIVLPFFSTLCKTNKDAIETELAQYCSETYKNQQCSVHNLDELIMNHTMCTSSTVNQNHPIVMEIQYQCVDEPRSSSTTPSVMIEASISTVVQSATEESQETNNLSSSSAGTIIGAICGVIIVAVAIIAAVFVTKRTNILQKLKRRTSAKDHSLKIHNNLSNERGAHLQYCDILKREDNDEHVYNTPIDEKGTEDNSKNSSKNLHENRVSEANDRAEYAVIKEIDINDRIPQGNETRISSNDFRGETCFNPSVNGHTCTDYYAVLDPNETGFERKCINQEGYKRSGDTNFKPFENDQSNDYAVLDPNETGYERNGKNQEDTRCSDEDKHDYGKLDPNEALSSNVNKYVKNNDYGILDPNETGYNRSGLRNNGDTNMNEDMMSQGISESISEDYSVLDPNETGFNRTNETAKVSETGLNPIVASQTPAFNALDDYTVLDPIATGFCRTPGAINQTVVGPDKGQTQPISNIYELAKLFEQENANAREDIND